MEEVGIWKRLAYGRGWHMEEVGIWKRLAYGRGGHREREKEVGT
jgi:hypothetical protein